MLDGINNKLKRIVFGIKFRKSYSIEDNFGNIVDELLYSDGTPYPPEFFPITESRPFQRNLVNRGNDGLIKQENKLTINTDDIVLDLEIFDPNDLLKYANDFINKVAKDVLRKFKIVNIERIGYLKQYKIEEVDNKWIENINSIFASEEVDGVSGVQLSYSRKHQSKESLIKSGCNDYINLITKVNRPHSKTSLYLSTDYQKYFSPSVDFLKESELKELFKKHEKYSSEVFENWVCNFFKVKLDG